LYRTHVVTFPTFSYNAASKAKRAQKDKKAKYGSVQGKTHLTPKQEGTIWTALVNRLRKEDQLPAIAFTLSRNRCDQNARNLTHMDLTTGESQKNFIRQFFDRSIQNLKEPDRALRQVKLTLLYFAVVKPYHCHTSLLNGLILWPYFCTFGLIFRLVNSSFNEEWHLLGYYAE
jgi:superfamily II RNA helicase